MSTLRQRVGAAVRAFRSGPGTPEDGIGIDAVADNFGYNSKLWSGYSEQWDDPSFRAQNAEGSLDPDAYEVLGEEWGEIDDVEALIAEWILPHLQPNSRAAEIGSGGGRVARRVAPKVQRLYCLDNAPDMLRRLTAALKDEPALVPVLLTAPALPEELAGSLDFIYAFDVFVHFDLHLLWKYAQEMAKTLKPGGLALFHTSNLTAPDGWARFAAQDQFRIEGHYFVSPEIVRTLVSKAGLELVRESSVDPSNVYLARDYLCLARKPS
jgi:SAM-dependent methyltransferase